MHASRTLTIFLVVAAVAPSLGGLGQRRQFGDDPPPPDPPATPSPTLSPTMSPSVSPTVYCFRDDLERKLQRILFALHNYHDVYRHFPPERFGATGPADLTQSLSWRVYILPFLGYDALYSNFVLDEPWDSPANQAAAAMGMPDEYRILGQALTDTTTRFLAPVDSIGAGNFDAILDSTVAEGSRLRDIIDGTSNTIMLGVASAGAAVEWTSPDDVTFADHPTVGDASGFAATVDYTPVVMADGDVQWLRHNALSAATFEALVSRNGGEVVDGNAPGLGETPNCDGLAPTPSPTVSPTASPTTTAPTLEPTTTPTDSPTTSAPTVSPTVSPSTSSPSVSPTTSSPTESPTASPTTTAPTVSPTVSPSTSSPTVSPTTSSPTASPNPAPTDQCVRRGHWCHDDECCEGNVCRRHWLLWWHKKCLPCKRRGSKCGSRNECCSGRSRRFGRRLRCD